MRNFTCKVLMTLIILDAKLRNVVDSFINLSKLISARKTTWTSLVPWWLSDLPRRNISTREVYVRIDENSWSTHWIGRYYPFVMRCSASDTIPNEYKQVRSSTVTNVPVSIAVSISFQQRHHYSLDSTVYLSRSIECLLHRGTESWPSASHRYEINVGIRQKPSILPEKDQRTTAKTPKQSLSVNLQSLGTGRRTLVITCLFFEYLVHEMCIIFSPVSLVRWRSLDVD